MKFMLSHLSLEVLSNLFNLLTPECGRAVKEEKSKILKDVKRKKW